MANNIQTFADTPKGYRGGERPDLNAPAVPGISDRSKQLSRKITVLSFLAMIGVIYIHHNAVEEGAATWNAVAQGFLACGLTAWAVPFFFVVSGFWFARGAFMQGRQGYAQLWAKKARTLLVPYLLWAVIGAAIALPVLMFNNHVTHRPLFDRTFLGQDGLWEIVSALFGISRGAPSGDFALWYVRALLIFFCFAPFWRLIFKFRRQVFLALGLLLTLWNPDAGIPLLKINSSALGWFFFGMGAVDLIGENRRLPRGAAIACGVLWIALAFLDACGCAGWARRLNPFAGILFLWSIAGLDGLFRDFMKPTFWVYCLHMPLTAYSLSGPLFVFGKSDVSTFLIMLLMPWANLSFCLVAAHVVRRFSPRVYALLTGGRG